MQKTKVFTISGSPFSGKKTTIDGLVKEFIKEGYDKSQIHVVHANKEKENTIKSDNGEIWIYDAGLGYINIPDSFSIRLNANDKVSAQRYLAESNSNESVENAKRKVQEMNEEEQKGVKQKYGIDLNDPANYNMVIDTSYSKPEDVVSKIAECEKCQEKGEPYGKLWASPKIFLPTQGIRDTSSRGFMFTFDDMIDTIKEEGYYPDEEIEIIEYEDKKLIKEGHHRNFALAKLGGTLIPYKTVLSDKSKDPKEKKEAIAWGNALSRRNLFDHEPFFDTKDKQFSYNDIYEGIYDKLWEKQLQRYSKANNKDKENKQGDEQDER